MGSGKLIIRAIKKYGVQNFTKEILHVFNNEIDMNNKEKELVVLHEDSYNLCEGGKGGFGYINNNELNWTLEKNTKISGFKKLSTETRKYYSSLGGKAASEKTSLRNSLQKGISKPTIHMNTLEANEKKKETYKKTNHQQGSKNSQYGTIWITDGTLNKKIKNVDNIPEGWYKGKRKNKN